jgi:DNA-binding protein H-NS
MTWTILPAGTSASIAFRKRTRYAFFCGVPDCLLCCLLLNKTENPKWLREENTICPDWIFKDLDLRSQVDQALSSYRSTLEKQLAALGSSVASIGDKVARGVRESLKKTKVAPKFKGPSGELWAGRGAKPRWLVAAIKEGKKAEDFLIKKTTRTSKKARRRKK